MRRFLGFRAPPSPPRPAATASSAPIPAMCPECGAPLVGQPRFSRLRVCDECGAHFPISCRDRIAAFVDARSFRETDAALASTDPLGFTDDFPYVKRLREQQTRAGQADALVTGTATLLGHRIVLAVLDFGFMGGSMGVVVGEKVVRAAELARTQRIPLITIVASGGARMQEGMLSLMQMAKTAAAIQQLHTAGVPYLSVLTHPTTGGVFASFASLGDVIVAEPKALIGFAGPRVVEQVLGRPLPPGSHSAEFLLAHGLVDDVIDRVRLRRYLGVVLAVLADGAPREVLDRLPATAPRSTAGQAWEIVTTARHPDRPTTLDYVARIVDDFVELHGDRATGEDPAVVAGLGTIGGRSVAIVGFERGHGEAASRRRHGRPLPEGYRKAQRIMRLAACHRLPVLTLIDTPGAYPGIESEERGLASEIAESMALMSELRTPIVAAIVGEGGSGGALALAVADRVLMQEQAIYSVIAPEGAAAILYRDTGRAPEIAEKLKLTASDLEGFGIIDTIVAEPAGSARADPDVAAELLKRSIVAAVDDLAGRPIDRLVQARYERYRAYGRSFVAIDDDATRRTRPLAAPASEDEPRDLASGRASDGEVRPKQEPSAQPAT